MSQFAQLTADRRQEMAFCRRASFAHVAHAVEIVHLRRVVLGFFSQVKQGIVHLLERIADPRLQALVDDVANAIQKLANLLAGRRRPLSEVDDFA